MVVFEVAILDVEVAVFVLLDDGMAVTDGTVTFFVMEILVA